MPCIVPEDIDNTDHDPEIFTCRASRHSSWKGEHIECDLEGGEEYFFSLVMTPTDPGSFVGLSGIHRCSAHRPPFSPPYHSPSSPAVPLQSADDDHDVTILTQTTDRLAQRSPQNPSRSSQPNVSGLSQVPADTSKHTREGSDAIVINDNRGVGGPLLRRVPPESTVSVGSNLLAAVQAPSAVTKEPATITISSSTLARTTTPISGLFGTISHLLNACALM